MTDKFISWTGEEINVKKTFDSVSKTDGYINVLTEQIQRLTKRKNTLKFKKDKNREYLRSNMEHTGITNIEHPLFNITLGKPSDIVEIENEILIPQEYFIVTKALDKKRALSDLKDGVDIPGLRIGKSKSKLIIK